MLGLAAIEAARARLRDAIIRLGVVLQDRPGALSRVAALIAAERGDIVHIEHDRAFSRWTAIGETEVELTLETSGRAHAEGVVSALRTAGYRVEERLG